MTTSWLRGILILALLAAPSSCFTQPRPDTQVGTATTVLNRSGRWFTVNGKYQYLVGVDIQELVADPRIDYTHVLDVLQSYHINKIRIWIYGYFGGTRFLHPWKYSIVSQKFDLDSWNPPYWRRLTNAVTAAQQRDIVVEVSIFGPNNVALASNWSNPRFRSAWNKTFNLNGAFTANLNGDFVPQFFELDYPERSSSGKTLQQYQQALVDKAIEEIGTFPNVYFEVANEFPVVFDSSSDAIDRLYPWQLHWAKRIKETTDRPVATHSHQGSGPHTHGVQYFDDTPYIDILNFHFYSSDPTQISRLLHPLQGKRKVLACNESFDVPSDLDKATREAWGWFLSGGYYAFYTSVNLIGERNWDLVGQRAKALRDIAEKVPFWQMAPVDHSGKEYDSLVRQGPTEGNWQVLARPGFEYVVFFWGQHVDRSVTIQLPSGDYDFQWYDPRNERMLLKGSIHGEGATAIAAPAKASWDSRVGVALLLWRSEEHPGVGARLRATPESASPRATPDGSAP